MNEGNVHNMCLSHNFSVMYDAEEYIKENCYIISFSKNYEYCGVVQEGTNHPAMWAHYADDSNGVCIVIDKDAFIDKNKDILSRYFYKFEDVEYSIFNTPEDENINFDVDTPQKFIMKNWKSLFFLKHKDWENEDEHRLFVMDYNGKFSIDGCIKYIVLGRKLYQDNARIKEILDMVVNPCYTCYHKLVQHSFASISYSIDGYLTFEIASKIDEIIKSNTSDPLYANYQSWLEHRE